MSYKTRQTFATIGLVCTVIATGFSFMAQAAPSDPVVFTFAVTGDSRQNPKDPDLTRQQKLWMQDTPVLARILRQIERKKPKALFFTGDMIMGFTTNYAVTARQYAYWRGMMSAPWADGIYVVPVAGNHEMQVKLPNPNGGKPHKLTEPACENLWRKYMGDLILNTNRWRQDTGFPAKDWNVNHAPRIGGPDHLETDQRQLSFSFDCQQMHFVIINTSACGRDGRAPLHWLAADLAQAKKRGDRHFFIFGHKMAFTYKFNAKVKPSGLDAHPAGAKAFWKLLERYDASYFCAHEHLYHAMQPQPGPHEPWQIICGAAGAPFDAKPGESKNPLDRYYAWVYVQVHRSGRVHLTVYGFNEHLGPTRVIQSFTL